MRKLFFLFVTLVATTTLWAYDFQSGDLYCNSTSEPAVEVTDNAQELNQTYTVTIQGYNLHGYDPTDYNMPIHDLTKMQFQVPEGTEVQFREEGGCDIIWLGWSDGVTDKDRTIVVTSDTTITSLYENARYYTVNIKGLNLYGSYEYYVQEYYCEQYTSQFYGESSFQITMREGCSISFRDESESGTWLGWSDGVTDKERTIVVTSDTTISSRIAYTISTAIYQEWDEEPRGTVYGDTTVVYGEAVTLSAKSNYGYHLAYWQDEDWNQYREKNYPITVKAKVPAHWTDEITVWIWNDNDMYPDYTTKEGDWYTYTYYAEYGESLNIIFRNGDYWSGDANQTIDITNVEENIWIEITQEGDEKATYTIVKSEPIPTPKKDSIATVTVYPYRDMTYTAYFDKNTYYITKNYDSNQGYVDGYSSGEYLDNITLTAEANYGYHFVQWSDGNTDNPRHFILTQDTTFFAEFAQTFFGQCGDNLYWSYQNNSLIISGFGEMYDERPWGLFTNEIQTVVLPNGITHIGNDAFSDCTGLNEITIPYTVTSIGDYAFAGCRKLVHVNCYAINPPMAESTSFANYNVYLNVPCDNLQDYQLDMVFGSFKYIQCMEADSENVPTDDVVVTPGTNDVTITWPTAENADTYTIVIQKGNEVFCTLTFNAEGQLLNIAFAPSRDGNNRPAQYAEQAGNGYRFTVTGLEAGTDYTYDITVKDASNQTINSHTGEFSTQSTTAVDNIPSPTTTCQKLLRDGQLLILRDGKTYTVIGQEL